MHGVFARLGRRGAILALAACAAGCAAEPIPSPATGADPGPRRAGPLVWLQLCEQVWSVPPANELAARQGAEGWELVAMYNGVLCFKRPVPGPGLRMESGPPIGDAARLPGYMPAVREPGF